MLRVGIIVLLSFSLSLVKGEECTPAEHPKCLEMTGPQPDYDEKLAILMTKVSMYAYNEDPATCMKNGARVTLVKKFQLVGGLCGHFLGANHTCTAFIAQAGGSLASYAAFIGGGVMPYFDDVFRGLWEMMKDKFQEVMMLYPHYDLWITGHSLGGALASLAAAKITKDRLFDPNRIKLITIGMPRVGNYHYAKNHEELVPYSFRLTFGLDPVPRMPFVTGCDPLNASPTDKCPWHHGTEVYYDPEPMSLTGGTQKKICLGKPRYEDDTCMNKHPVAPGWLGFDQHEEYFQMNKAWLESEGCPSVANIL